MSGGDESPAARRQRADAQRNRVAVIAAAAQLLREARPLTMQTVAETAGVSRSTLYRHFRNPEELQHAVREESLTRVAAAIAHALSEQKPPLALLRGVVTELVRVGAELPLHGTGPPQADAVAAAADALRPLAERLSEAAALSPTPSGAWLRSGLAHFVEACAAAGWDDPIGVAATSERLLRTLTEPLDRGLLLLDEAGCIVSLNPEVREALGGAEALEAGRRVVVRDAGIYEDGSDAAPEAHPVNAALASGEPQAGVRGQRARDGALRWYSIQVQPLRNPSDGALYGFVAVFIDVSTEKRFELARLRRPGELAATEVPLLDVLRVLDEVPPPLLPEQLVAEAMRLAAGPVALYVLDIDGSHLLRLAGSGDFPARLKAPLAVGPELAEDGLPELTAALARELPGVVMAPMWLRGRAVGVLLGLRNSDSGLHEVARLGAAAMELGGGYTDVFDDARRRKQITPAAEIQQSLLPPRIVRMGSGELAGSVLPAYDVGGDWFDYVENRDGAWIAIADAAGRGARAGALGSIGLAALRAARRNGETLDEAVQTMHETVLDAGELEFFLTAIVARWHSIYSVFSWIDCGHPPPLLIRADGDVEELATQPDLPLGLGERKRSFRRHQRRLDEGDRLVLYSDGLARRRVGDGLFGTAGIVRAVRDADARSATATVRAVLEAVSSVSEDPLPDDAAVVVLAASAPRTGAAAMRAAYD